MKTKRNKPICGIIALLSFLAMAVAFLVPCPPAVIAFGAVFFFSCIVLGSCFFGKVEDAFTKGSTLFDDYGYL